MSKWKVENSECLAALKRCPSDFFDSMCTDPPSGTGFMGKDWDCFRRRHNPADVGRDNVHGRMSAHAPHSYGESDRGNFIAFMTEVMKEALRVLKPGAHCLVWALPRTSHWTATALEDAGFEVRDCITHHFGSGFPKSADIAKQMDSQEKNRWSKVCKEVDNISVPGIIEVWKDYSNSAKSAGLQFVRSQTATGTNTERSDSVLAAVPQLVTGEKSHVNAITAELTCYEAPPIAEEPIPSALLTVEGASMAWRSFAAIAEDYLGNLDVRQSTTDSIVLADAAPWRSEGIRDNLKAVEALRTWLGSNRSSKPADTIALCVALTEDWKRIILSRSKTFQSLDTKSQMEHVSAMTATITVSMAESLISFTADILKQEAIDKMAGAEREVMGYSQGRSSSLHGGGQSVGTMDPITAPATPEAKTWDGWGTALKPATEHWILCRKPLAASSIARNVLTHGTGALNIAGTRVNRAADDVPGWHKSGANGSGGYNGTDTFAIREMSPEEIQERCSGGRWPPNLLLSHSAECAEECATDCPVAELDRQSGVTSSKRALNRRGVTTGTSIGGYSAYGTCAPQEAMSGHNDSGGASRFFPTFRYQAKESRANKEAGLDALPVSTLNRVNPGGLENEPRFAPVQVRNNHPTVKSIELCRWLCRLITPPGGAVLDPFAGSGSTGCAALLEGFDFFGIEQDPHYVEICRARLAHWGKQ